MFLTHFLTDCGNSLIAVASTVYIRNLYILVHKLDVEIAWLNLYGMIFHEEHTCGYGFPSQPLATCASAGVSELFLSTPGFATCA